ncbi:MAG: HEAT repeat domain-containing protein [Deltaproteobacteria bacterium]|nr:HEAT repeat domain-containing protein [Deltaproteobacteria bacterium]
MAEVIPLKPQKRLFDTARKYVSRPGLFERERERAVPLLLSVVALGETKLRHPILMLLSSQGVAEAAGPLHGIMNDPGEPPHLRHFAAWRLGVLLSRMPDPEPWPKTLMKEAGGQDAFRARLAVTALAWEGNHQAFDVLAGCLEHRDPLMRSAAIYALCRLHDPRAWPPLSARLAEGCASEKKAILYNLWRLPVEHSWLQQVYRDHLSDKDPDIRLLCLALLDKKNMRENGPHVAGLLGDPDPRVRRVALRQGGDLPGEVLAPAVKDLERMLSDPDMEIKRMALEALKKARRGSSG